MKMDEATVAFVTMLEVTRYVKPGEHLVLIKPAKYDPVTGTWTVDCSMEVHIPDLEQADDQDLLEMTNLNEDLLNHIVEVEETLAQIVKCEGEYSSDQLTHAGNTIVAMKELAAGAKLLSDEIVQRSPAEKENIKPLTHPEEQPVEIRRR